MISIKIEECEKRNMLRAIKQSKGKVISVAKLAAIIKMNPNRARWVIEELIDEGKVKKVQAKAFNEKYIRYTYEVI